jgi:fatty acid desaturase
MPTTTEHLNRATNRIYVQVLAIYALVALVVWLASRPEPGVTPAFLASSLLAWGVIGWCQFALFNALHEGLHNRFGSPHLQLPCYALAAYPMGFDEGYRRVHLDHHRYFGDPERDPDFPNYGDFPRSRRAFLLRLFLNLCGWYAVLQFLGRRQATGRQPGTGATGLQNPVWKVLAVQCLILAIFALTVGWLYYIWLWLAPLVTFCKFFTSTRTLCEHGSPDGASVIRTITGPYPEEKLLGIFCFNYHAEHHHSAAIPYQNLRTAHSLLRGELYGGQQSPPPRYEHYDRCYLHLLYQWFTALPS